jgi:hypothetical protein
MEGAGQPYLTLQRRPSTRKKVDGTLLAKALAERLAAVLPPGFSITATESSLWLETPDGLGNSAWAGLVDRDRANLDLYPVAALNVLSSVQDGVSISLREPWPLLNAPGRQMAMPGAKVVDRMLMSWYGDEDTPTISFPPIALNDGDPRGKRR